VLAALLHASFGLTTFATMGPPTEFMTSTASEGYKLAVRRWSAATKGDRFQPKATVVLQHGGGWHSGYYDELGSALSGSGYEVVALDAMGHGYSEGPLRDSSLNQGVKADQGQVQTGVTYWTGLNDAQADLRKLCAQEKAVRARPLVVVAESIGVLVGVPLAMAPRPRRRGLRERLSGAKDPAADAAFPPGDAPSVDAVVTTGGCMQIAKETQPPGIVCFVFEVLGRFIPKRNVILKDLDQTFDAAFGRDEWAQAARADPLISTNSFYLGPISQQFKGMKRLRAGAGEMRLPLYVMHSKADPRTSAEAATTFYEDAASADKEITLYEDASHLLFQDTEANTKRAIRDLTAWLDKRFSGGP